MSLIFRFKREILLFLLISVLYFLFRLMFLTRLPIFTDEAIYLRWAQIALNDSSWRFIALTDGKQPMFVWVAMVFMKFIEDPLLAGRLVSVFSGFFTMIGLFLLTQELFKNKTMAFLTSLLYIFYPFAQVLDRMALYDSMVGMFYVWALYLAILLVRKIRLDIAYTLGFVIAGGVLTKSSNFFSIYLLPFLLILFNFKEKHVVKRLLKFILLAGFSTGIAYGFYNILRLSPLYEMISIKNSTFVFPFSEWIHHPLMFFGGNFSGQVSWLLQYLTPAYSILIILSLLFIFRHPREKTLLFIYFALPFIALAIFGKLIYPRHFFFMTLMLLPLSAWSLCFIFEKLDKMLPKNFLQIARLTLIFIFIAYSAYVSILFAVDPISAPIADSDRNQYINSWSAGWGVKESIDFFKNQAKDGKIFIATEGTFGLMPESMELYLVQNKNITIKGYWPVKENLPQETLDYAKKMPSFFIFYQPEHRIMPTAYPLELIFELKQGKSNYFYRVYKIVKQ